MDVWEILGKSIVLIVFFGVWAVTLWRLFGPEN